MRTLNDWSENMSLPRNLSPCANPGPKTDASGYPAALIVELDLLQAAILTGVGIVAGFLNVMAGGGSLLTVPLLVMVGLPGGVANGSNRVGVLLQSVVAVWSFPSSPRLYPQKASTGLSSSRSCSMRRPPKPSTVANRPNANALSLLPMGPS